MKNREIRTISCTNELGYTINFGETSISPFLLIDCDGIYNYEYNVTTQDNGNVDGSTVIGSKLKERNIVITVADIDGFVIPGICKIFFSLRLTIITFAHHQIPVNRFLDRILRNGK